MSKNDKDIQERWIDDVLTSTNGMQRAASNPFLFTRIKARLQEANSTWEKTARLVSRPVFAFATIVLILAINIWVAFQQGPSQGSTAKAPKMDAELLFAAEYSNNHNYSLIDPSEVK